MGKPGNHKKKKLSKRQQEQQDAIANDDRFAAAHNRPQFRAPSSHHKKGGKDQQHKNSKVPKDGKLMNTESNNSKIVLDDRFKSVLTDSRFQIHEKDKYGRKQSKRDKAKTAKDELGAFYTIADDDDDDDEKEPKEENNSDGEGSDDSDDASVASGKEKKNTNNNTANSSDAAEQEEEDPASRIAYLTALSRGEINISSSSESEDSGSDDDSSEDDDSSAEGEDPVHGTAGVLDPSYKHNQAETTFTHEASKFLAVTNLDWSHMRAADVFAILSSFCAPGTLKRVQVFVSDFGKEKMASELTQGPGMLWKKEKKIKETLDSTASDSDGSDSDDGDSDDGDSGPKGKEENKNISKQDGDTSGSDDDDDNDDDEGSVALEADDMDVEEYAAFIQKANEQQAENDFDAEKLRAYEASKLRYYFAVAEFTSPEHADSAYKEVDGMEFEHSSAAVDMRSIPEDAVEGVVKGRTLRDEVTSIPGNYVPPDFVVTALQQTNVQCSWEAGDTERERLLTKHSSASTEQWAAMAENDDLKAYLASDNSSDEDSDEEGEKGSKLRKMLGLDSDSDANSNSDSDAEDESETKPAKKSASGKGGDSDDEEDNEFSKEMTYVPGQMGLQEKIRSKLQSKNEEPTEEQSPWEKYQQKRKDKRREKRQTTRRKRSDVVKEQSKPRQKGPKGDSFFMGGSASDNDDDDDENDYGENEKQSKEELELLLAGDNDEEAARDFDMRGIQRIEKNRDKKLRGPRKRKEEKLASGVAGQDFAVNVKDDRFAAVLEGDANFGIDRTAPEFKETQAMRDILEEQKKRRKKKRKKSGSTQQEKEKVPPNVVEDSGANSAGSNALSSLVMSLKSKVAKTSQ